MKLSKFQLGKLSWQLILFLGFIAGFIACWIFESQFPTWPILNQAKQILEQHGLTPLPEAPQLEYGMIRGMLQAYNDPFSNFVEPIQHELETNTLEGSFGGIGVRLGRDISNQVVLYPLPDSPAAQAGVLDNDRLIQVEDVLVLATTPYEEIQALIRGPVGTPVKILISRPPANEVHEIIILRDEILLPSVSWHIHPDQHQIGVIEVNVIAASTVREIQTAVSYLETQGAEAYILDLRDNFGGLLTAGVDTARLFLSEGVIIEQQYRGKMVESYTVDEPGPLVDLQLVVLVNQHTASAAEIVAGALQAHRRTLLIGSQTFGKNTIQLVFDLKDGSSLHVTSARWWIPGNESFTTENGLLPDIAFSPEAMIAEPNMVEAAAIEALLK